MLKSFGIHVSIPTKYVCIMLNILSMHVSFIHVYHLRFLYFGLNRQICLIIYVVIHPVCRTFPLLTVSDVSEFCKTLSMGKYPDITDCAYFYYCRRTPENTPNHIRLRCSEGHFRPSTTDNGKCDAAYICPSARKTGLIS